MTNHTAEPPKREPKPKRTQPQRDIAAEVRETLRLEDPARLWPSRAAHRGETTAEHTDRCE